MPNLRHGPRHWPEVDAIAGFRVGHAWIQVVFDETAKGDAVLKRRGRPVALPKRPVWNAGSSADGKQSGSMDAAPGIRVGAAPASFLASSAALNRRRVTRLRRQPGGFSCRHWAPIESPRLDFQPKRFAQSRSKCVNRGSALLLLSWRIAACIPANSTNCFTTAENSCILDAKRIAAPSEPVANAPVTRREPRSERQA